MVDAQPRLVLTVGLPGAGKTTWARAEAESHALVRLTPDDWMAPMFGHSDANGRRDILEGRMIWVAHEVLRAGASVVLDFGCWSPEERYAIRSMAERAGASFTLKHLHVPEDVRRERCDRRWREAPGSTFPMTDDDQDFFLRHFRPPTAQETGNGPIPEPPEGFRTWSHWASDRWPTLPRFD